MALISPDFTDTKGQLEPGAYKARITASEVKTSQAGNLYVRWKFETFGTENPLHNGVEVYTSTPVAGKGAFRLHQLLKAALGELPPVGGQFDTEALHGREVMIDVIDGKDQGGQPTGFSEVKTIRKLA